MRRKITIDEARNLFPKRDKDDIFIVIDGEEVSLEPLMVSNIARAWFTVIASRVVGY